MRLRYIETASFGRSELTNFLNLIRRRPEFAKEGHASALGKNDVVVLISRMGDQLLFISGFAFLEPEVGEGAKARTFSVLRSVKLRLSSRARWNPLMLADYAKKVGIELQGLKTYEEYIKTKVKED